MADCRGSSSDGYAQQQGNALGAVLLGIGERQNETDALVELAAGLVLANEIAAILEEEYEHFVAHACTAACTRNPAEHKFSRLIYWFTY